MSFEPNRALIFDVGNVLLPVRLEATGEALASRTGLSVEAIAARLIGCDVVRAYQVGRLTDDAFREALSVLLESPLAEPEFTEDWNASLPAEPIPPPDLLVAVHDAGLRVIALSNTNARHARHLARVCPWLFELTEPVLSHDIGAAKPGAKAFEAARAATGLDASACFFTDDDPRHVEAARRFGFAAEHFTEEARCRRQLVRLGFLEASSLDRRGS
ncbi:MAG: HAD-IA family hydrolase [Planctomycetota bacterium]